MNPLAVFATSAPTLDISGITSAGVSTQGIIDIIETVFPLVGIAILTGVVFYCVRWALSLFRGI